VNALRECESKGTQPASAADGDTRGPELTAVLDTPAARPRRVEFKRYVGWVTAATLLVAVLPAAFVWWIRTEDIISSPFVTLGIALVVTLVLSRIGTAYWEKRSSPGDLLFGELLLWGFIRRCNSERRLLSARAVLGSLAETHGGAGDGHTAGSQAESLEKLSAALEATDPYTHGHSRRVARHCWMIAKRMGLDGDTVARVRTAAALHDVGKVYTPSAILRKPGRLTDGEFEMIKRHPVDGAEMVKALGDAELVSIVRHHHERLDGTGYPDRLVGEQIPIGARIISVADTFDAITSARPYRQARAHKKALDILKYEAGTQLDPAVVKAFCAIYSGRRPLALWASLTSLPSQIFSWVGAGAASAASAAQVAAVAAAAAVGVTAAVQPAPAPSRHAHSSVHATEVDFASRDRPAVSTAYVASTQAAARHGSAHKRVSSERLPTTAALGTRIGSTGTATGDTQAGAPTVSQTSGPATGVSPGSGDYTPVSNETAQTATNPAGGTTTTSSGAGGETASTGTPAAPKEGSGSKEGKKAKEEEAKRVREEERKAREEATKLKEEEAKKLKEEEAKKAKEEELRAEEQKKLKEEEVKKAKEEKAAKEGKSSNEEKKAKEGKGIIKEVVEKVLGST
jgi:putative nucleotidyltransferase with HDIG domain